MLTGNRVRHVQQANVSLAGNMLHRYQQLIQDRWGYTLNPCEVQLH